MGKIADEILEPSEEAHHIARDDTDGAVVADGHILDPGAFGGRARPVNPDP
jgi:hypothetical protein